MILNGFSNTANQEITCIINKFKGFLTSLMFPTRVTYRSAPFLATVLVASP